MVLSLLGGAVPGVSAEAAILMHEDGTVLYSKNSDKQMLIASTTKIMTAILVLENCGIDDIVEIENEFCAVEGSSMYLKAGERYTVEELLCGLMLASGNDAAVALACHTAGNEKAFAAMMNRKANELGMKNTRFANPHGLNADGHYSTASDLAKLMAYCMGNDDFVRISSMRSVNIKDKTFLNHNKLLYMYPGCIGGKTGYTEKAGRCLVSCAERDGMRMICVTLSAPDDWNDHRKLYDAAFSEYCCRDVSESLRFDVPVISGNSDTAVLIAEPTRIFCSKNDELRLVAEMPKFVFAPVRAGDTGGRYKLMLDEKCIAEGLLLYADNIEIESE